MRDELIHSVMWLLKQAPGRISCALQRWFLPGRIPPGAMALNNVQIDFPEKLAIAALSSVNRGSVLNCGGGLEIGADALIGSNRI